MSIPIDENILLQETNKGGYTLSIVAKFPVRFPVQYVIRVSNPEGTEVEYMSTLEGFKNIGELLTALHYFAQTKLYPKDIDKLREVLTADSQLSPFLELGTSLHCKPVRESYLIIGSMAS